MASAATLSVALLLVPATAGAFVHGTFGLQQRKPVFLRNGPLQYHAGPVIHASDSYAIYWDPLELYNPRWMTMIDEYFQNVGTASNQGGDVFAMNAQYGERGYSTASGATAGAKEAHAANASTFRGAYTDTDPYPPKAEECAAQAAVVCLPDQALKAELQKVIASGVLPGATGTVAGTKSTPVYYILTPPGVTVCAENSAAENCSNSTALEHESTEIAEKHIMHPAETGICGYHSTVNPGGANPIVYAVQPWIAGDAGLFIEAESPLKTSGTSADVLACQDRSEVLEEPNQTNGLDPFAEYGAGLADVVIGDLANEQSNLVVNPELNAWFQNASPEEHGFPEQGDMCQWAFDLTAPGTPNEATHADSKSNENVGAGSYYLHWGYNSSGFLTGKSVTGCWQGASLEPHITAPNPVNVGDVVALDANESAITLAAAPLVPRQGKEETRLSNEGKLLTAEETAFGNELTKLGEDEVKLAAAIVKLGEEEVRLAAEILLLNEESERVTANERKLTEERKAAEAGLGTISVAQEEAFAKTETRLIAERTRITAAKAADEKEKVTDGETKTADKAKEKADKERKPTIEKDKVILAGDKTIANEEKALATEHKIFETEPILAPVYRWDFGFQENGHEVTEEGEEKASVFHTFPCAKTYHVKLTVEDGGGFEAQPANATEIKVEGKPCEGAAPASGGSGGPGGSTQTPPASTGASGAPTAAKTTPAPVATSSVLSRSLAGVLKSGLVVRYSVNEQVAGRFEVLLAASIARHLGLHGPAATGLPNGTAPQIVIAKAILITTRGGRNTVKILLPKSTATRLHRLHKVSLMVRLVVRNASPKSPASTTSVSTVTLTG
jgi:hypothetical protein